MLYPLKMKYQKVTKGWNDEDIYSLADTFAVFMAPRLRAMAEKTETYPISVGDLQAWKDLLIRLANMFDVISRDNGERNWTEEEYNDIVIGMDIFAVHYLELWL